MAFFGFDAFAGLSRRDEGNAAFEFEDTYDGLGEQLDETDDVHNADTFGAGAADVTGGPSLGSNEFDFSGQTAMMADTLEDEHVLYAARQRPVRHPSPPRPAAKPAKTGYEKYGRGGVIPDLEVNADIWGLKPSAAPRNTAAIQKEAENIPTAATSAAAAPSRKMMSLEEVEASIRSQSRSTGPAAAHAFAQPSGQSPLDAAFAQPGFVPSGPPPPPHYLPQGQPQILQRPQQQPYSQPGYFQQPQHVQQQQQFQYGQPPRPGDLTEFGHQIPAPQILQRPPPAQTGPSPINLQQGPLPPMAQPQHPRHVHHPSQGRHHQHQQSILMGGAHSRGPSLNGPGAPSGGIAHPDQLMHLSEEDRAAFLEEEAKRARRNQKIHQLSRDNGLMTPQDKNFISRIQLQQLLTATGNVDEGGPEVALMEDFYYQVFSQIRGAPRQHPNQPLNLFAQTYLNQTGGRNLSRRYPRGGDSQYRRMEQQVQRAVEAAKLKPKNRQLVIEGSLGKISFSNAKTPKPLLNIKRPEDVNRAQNGVKQKTVENRTDRKAVLRDIESLYVSLMRLEDHERRMPPQPKEESSADEIQAHMDWRATLNELSGTLWPQLKVLEPIDSSRSTSHPFIAILSHPKGKKLMSRVFRQIDEQQRLTVLTMIVFHLDQLDVVRMAAMAASGDQLPRSVREEIELFSQAVMPGLFNYVNEAQLKTVVGLLGLIVDRVQVSTVVRTKVGLAFLTMLISRAEILKQGGHAEGEDLEQWDSLYRQLFDLLEPYLPSIFTRPVASGEDTYVWQFLAAIGIGASPEQQQRLVIAVKERVMESVTHAKTLPEDISQPRLDNVNLFMKAIGLHVDLLG